MAKITAENDLDTYFFNSHLRCVWLPCIACGTLVRMNNDEWEHLQAASTPPPLFRSGARVGLAGIPAGQNVVEKDFF